MKLSDVIDAYITSRRAVGVRLSSGGRILRQFMREIGDVHLHDVTPEAVLTFLQGRAALSAAWTTKRSALAGLYRFAIARGYIAASPLPRETPKLPPPQTPYVYSTDELRRLLDATAVLHSDHSRLQAVTYRTLLLLLYGAGLRIGEALGLKISDVDLVERVITVRDTKFYKTRLVPIGPKLARVLANFTALRHALPLAQQSALFATRTGRRLSYPHVITLFQRVRRAAWIGCPLGELRPPRLHDLRHTAAVHRVVAWYRTGKDVQHLLPQLATYLGHVDIRSTQRYLRMTPELLQEASLRFAAYAHPEANHE
jgi:integrase/recombinase XerD